MTTHTLAIDLSQDQPPLPNQHFSSWLRGQTMLFISQISAILGFVLFLASLVYYVSHLGEHSEILKPLTVKLIVDYAHVIFMAVFILALIQVLDDNERGSYRVKLVYKRVFKGPRKGEDDIEAILKKSKNQLRTFKLRFLWFWIGMLCLYICFACQHSYDLANSEPEERSVYTSDLSFSLKNRSSNGQEENFETEVNIAIPDKAKHASTDPHTPEERLEAAEVRRKLTFPFFAFLFNNLTLLSVFWCFLVMYLRPEEIKGKKEFKYKAGSAAIAVSLTFLFPTLALVRQFKGSGFTASDVMAYSAIFDALSGVINAMVLALLIARLNSKLIGLPSWLISILYSYAAVQPLFLVFELSQSKVLVKIATSVLIFVFVSKIYFFLIIIYALQTGKMLNYLSCFPLLRKRAGAHREPDVQHASILEWLKTFTLSTIPGLVKKLGSTRGKRASVARLLSSRRARRVGEWFGWAAILYFFISLIGSQIIPKSPLQGGGLWNTAINVSSFILRPPDAFAVFIAFAQLVVVLMMIVILLLVLEENGYGGPEAMTTAQSIFDEPLEHGYLLEKGVKQLKKFKKYFLYFWCVTFLLYVALLLDPGIVFGSYEERSIQHMVELLFYPSIEFLLSNLNLLCIFWCFVALQAPAFGKHPTELQTPDSDERFDVRQKLRINYSSFVILLLSAVYPLLLFWIGGPKLSTGNLTDYATVFDGVTGTLSAVVLALLIAKMDSKLFNLPSRLIWMLFTYAAIQPLYIAFAQQLPVLQMVKTSVLTAALGLKICFFLIVTHSLQSGRALNYLVCFPILKERVDSIFENQFEIRLVRAEGHSFTISVLKKNQLYYSTEKRFKSREECDGFVHGLRDLMKERDAYFPREESGTHWVELRSADWDLRCESIPLRAKKEADDLITESMDRIPYCKYNRT